MCLLLKEAQRTSNGVLGLRRGVCRCPHPRAKHFGTPQAPKGLAKPCRALVLPDERLDELQERLLHARRALTEAS